jgi:hypothetical protein
MEKVVPFHLIYQLVIYHYIWRLGRQCFLFLKPNVWIGLDKSIENSKTFQARLSAASVSSCACRVTRLTTYNAHLHAPHATPVASLLQCRPSSRHDLRPSPTHAPLLPALILPFPSPSHSTPKRNAPLFCSFSSARVAASPPKLPLVSRA